MAHTEGGLSRSALQAQFASGTFATEAKFNSLASSFFNFADDTFHLLETPDSVEITRVVLPDATVMAQSGDASYWQFFTSDKAGRQDFYVWYSSGTATDPVGTGSGIEVGANVNDLAASVATNTASAIGFATGFASAFVTITASGDTIDLTTIHTGSVADAVDGATPMGAGFSVGITQEGSDGGVSAWNVPASGHLIPDIGSAQDIGSSAIPIRSLYMSGSSLWVDNKLTIYASDGNVTGVFDTISMSSIEITDINSSTDINITASNAVNIAGSAISLSSIGPVVILGSGVTILGADGGALAGADVDIIGGSSTSSSGGNVLVRGGVTRGTSSDRAGTVLIQGGSSLTTGDGDAGNVIIRGGQGGGAGDGDINPGDVFVVGGPSTAGSRSAGNVWIQGGSGSSFNDAGAIFITGGSTTDTNSDGGPVTITGGAGPTGSGGGVILRGGPGSTAGDLIVGTGRDLLVSATNVVTITGSAVEILSAASTMIRVESGSGVTVTSDFGHTGSTFTVNATQDVSITASGALTLTGSAVVIDGSSLDFTSSGVTIISASGDGFTVQRNFDHTGSNFTVTATQDVSITASGALTLTGSAVVIDGSSLSFTSSAVSIISASGDGFTVQRNFDHTGSNFTVNATQDVSITASNVVTVDGSALELQSAGSTMIRVENASGVTVTAPLEANEGLVVWSTDLTTGSAGGGGASAAVTHPIQLITAVAAVGTIDSGARGWTISVSGHLIPIASTAQDLGTAEMPLRNLFLAGSATVSVDGDEILTKTDGNVHVNSGAASALVVSAINNLDLIAGSNLTASADNNVTIFAGSDFLASATNNATVIAGSDFLASATNNATIAAGSDVILSASVDVSIVAGSNLSVSAGNVTIRASELLSLNGSVVTISSTNTVTIKGSSVSIVGSTLSFVSSGVTTISVSATGLDIARGDLTLSGSGQILLTNGCVSLTALSFADDNIGMYRGGINNLRFTTDGVDSILELSSTQVKAGTGGNQSAPGFGFVSQANTGMYWDGTVLGITSLGSTMIQLDEGSGVTILSPLEAQEGLEVWSTITTGSAGGGGASAAALQPIQLITNVAAVGTIDSGARGWTISVSGHLIPIGRSAQDLGTNDQPLRDLYLSGSSVSLDGAQIIGKSNGEVEFGGASADGKLTVSSLNNLFILAGSDLTISATNALSLSGSVVSIVGSTLSFVASGVNVISASALGFDIAQGDLTLSGSGQILAAPGTSALPRYSFAGDPDTGMFASTGFLRIVTGGVAGMEMVSGQVRFIPGTVAAPGISFKTETNAGIALAAGSAIHFVMNGSSLLRVTTASAVVATANLHAQNNFVHTGSNFTVTATQDVAITASGALTLTGSAVVIDGSSLDFTSSGVTIISASGDGFTVQRNFDHTGSNFTVTATQDVSITASGTITLQASGNDIHGIPSDLSGFVSGSVEVDSLLYVIPAARAIMIPTQNALTAYAATSGSGILTLEILIDRAPGSAAAASPIGTISWGSAQLAGSVDLSGSIPVALGDVIVIRSSAITVSTIADFGFTIHAYTGTGTP